MADLASAPLSWRRQHWNTHLERHALAVPDRAALRFEGRTTTWRRLRDRVRRLADALARRGVGAGDRVSLLTGNRPEFIEAMLAVTRLGAISGAVNFRLTAPEIAYVLEHSGARLLVVDGLAAGHPAIAEVGVVGRPHPRWGETPVAFAVLRDPRHEPSIEELREWASTRLARYKLPTALQILDALPRNASGKVLKPVLRERSAT